jgi:hypothetical protein
MLKEAKMRTFKISLLIILLSSVLFFATPVVTKAAEISLPPAVSFRLDKDDEELAQDDFSGDVGIWVKLDTDMDPSIYVRVPQKNP